MVKLVCILAVFVTVVVIIGILNDIKEQRLAGIYFYTRRMWPVYVFSYLIFLMLVGLIFV